MDEAMQTSGTSGRRLAIAIVVMGVLAAVAGLMFREFTPPSPPATQPAATEPSAALPATAEH
jgi:ABC-type xylose transport system permease subunit